MVSCPQVKVVGEAGSTLEAMELVRQVAPHLTPVT